MAQLPGEAIAGPLVVVEEGEVLLYRGVRDFEEDLWQLDRWDAWDCDGRPVRLVGGWHWRLGVAGFGVEIEHGRMLERDDRAEPERLRAVLARALGESSGAVQGRPLGDLVADLASRRGWER